jgi:hypothetical protein
MAYSSPCTLKTPMDRPSTSTIRREPGGMSESFATT